MTRRPASAQPPRDLAQLRRVRDRIDREYAQPLDAGYDGMRPIPDGLR